MTRTEIKKLGLLPHERWALVNTRTKEVIITSETSALPVMTREDLDPEVYNLREYELVENPEGKITMSVHSPWKPREHAYRHHQRIRLP